MKLLSLCDPTQYRYPPLDVPTFYQQLALDSRVELYHLPTSEAIAKVEQLPQVAAIPAAGMLSYDDFVALGNASTQSVSLEEVNLVFCRTLKPFHPTYLSVLSQWEGFTRFVNSPSGKQSQMKADFLLNIAQAYMPEAIATDQYAEALAFFEKHSAVVAKRANSTGGRGVFKIHYENGVYHVDNVLAGPDTFSTFSQVMSYLTTGQTEPIQFCRYLSKTTAGDKRVVVVDGEIYGSYLRRSRSGHWVNNVSADGDCTLADITCDEQAAINNTVSYYQQLGLHTLGYDFLMDDDGTWKISEINAGNIGGFARLELLTQRPVMTRLIDWLIAYSQRPPADHQLGQQSSNQAAHSLAVIHLAVIRLAVIYLAVIRERSLCVQARSFPVSSLKVRAAIARDYGAIAAIYNEAIAQGGITMDTQPYTAQTVQTIAEHMSRRESLLVGDFAGEVIGWGKLKRYSDRIGYRFCCETSVYVSFSAVGQGHGSRLQSALMEKAQALSYRHIVAKILAANQRSIRFHQRFGFDVVGVQKEIGFINQTWHDVVIMQHLVTE